MYPIGGCAPIETSPVKSAMSEIHRDYLIPIRINPNQKIFDEVEIGDCFVLPQTVGFGGIWIGFNVFLKCGVGASLCIQDGKTHDFKSCNPVLLCRIGDVQKPSNLPT